MEDVFKRIDWVNALFFLGITTLFSFFGGSGSFIGSGSSGGRPWRLLWSIVNFILWRLKQLRGFWQKAVGVPVVHCDCSHIVELLKKKIVQCDK